MVLNLSTHSQSAELTVTPQLLFFDDEEEDFNFSEYEGSALLPATIDSSKQTLKHADQTTSNRRLYPNKKEDFNNYASSNSSSSSHRGSKFPSNTSSDGELPYSSTSDSANTLQLPKPKFLAVPYKLEFVVGEQALLECLSNVGSPHASLSWSRTCEYSNPNLFGSKYFPSMVAY